jgi:hypothetical protein
LPERLDARRVLIDEQLAQRLGQDDGNARLAAGDFAPAGDLAIAVGRVLVLALAYV